MKPALVLLAILSLTACNTSSNHRDLWSPNKGRGPYTLKSRNSTLAGRMDHRSVNRTYVVTRQGPPPGPSSAAPAASPAPGSPAPTAGAATAPASPTTPAPPESVPGM